jgi:hypothetical protein
VAVQNCWSLAIVFLEALTLVSCASESSPVVEHTLGHAGALCGEDQLHTMQAYDAVRKGDKKSAAGLMSRGKVNFLKPGTIVRGSPHRDDGWTFVRIASGASQSKYCWIPSNALTMP